jgi:amino acid transporter
LFFKVFKEIDPKTKVPVKGAWITCFFVCLVCFFLNLEDLANIISLGNLISYSFVNAGAIAMRFRGPENHGLEVTRSKEEVYMWIFIVIAFLWSMSVGHDWPSLL